MAIVIKKGALKALSQRPAAAPQSAAERPAEVPAAEAAAAAAPKLSSPLRIRIPAPKQAPAAEGKGVLHGIRKSVLDQALDRAIEAEKIKDYFIMSVGRDLHKGIDNIAEIAQWLKDGTDDDHAYLQALDTLLSCSADLKAMLDDLIAVSKLDPNNSDSGKEPTDCAAQISGMAENFRAEALTKGVSLNVRVGHIPYLEIDAHRLRQLVKLLVENAVKFTNEGRIGVEASFAVGQLKLIVEDTGCGFAPDLQREFAESDRRADMTGETGMALSIIKRLVFSLGGEISLRSTPGIGTVFTVTIPNLKNVSGSRDESALSTMQRINMVIGGVGLKLSRGAKVLLVDDSNVNLAVINGLLKAMGFTNVDTAPNGSAALVKLLTEPYDIVLTDVRMPEMDGRTLVKEIRKIPAYEKMLVYGITVDDDVKDNYRDIGFTDVILKPVTREKLRSILG